MNSSSLSHRLDANKGLAEYVRLSFCQKHPMMFKALKDERITRPVILEIKLEIVSRPGILFCERNAAANDAQPSGNPNVIHYEVVKKQYSAMSKKDKRFYQGEVLVPGNVPPHLIRFPKVDAFNKPLSEIKSMSASTSANCSMPDAKAIDDLSDEAKGGEKSTTASAVETKAAVELDPGAIAPCALEVISPDSSCEALEVKIPHSNAGVGNVVAILADGNCCYHLAGVFGLLCRNANALSHGVARCLPKDIKAAREQILWNFRKWRSKHSDYLTEEEWETQVVETTGDFIDNFESRTFGTAKGEARLGSYTDLAIFTRHEDIRVVVICTDNIFRYSSRDVLEKSVYEAIFPGESAKLRVVCAVLSSRHFDIGVVHVNGTTRAVFELGSDWDCALQLILSFIQSRSPLSKAEKRKRLCPEWKMSAEPDGGCACGETSCDCASKN